jgi:hypothetical protein
VWRPGRGTSTLAGSCDASGGGRPARCGRDTRDQVTGAASLGLSRRERRATVAVLTGWPCGSDRGPRTLPEPLTQTHSCINLDLS